MIAKLQAVLNRIARPTSERVVRLGPRWYVIDLERPGELLHGPAFKTKRAAVEYATANALAVWERLQGGD